MCTSSSKHHHEPLRFVGRMLAIFMAVKYATIDENGLVVLSAICYLVYSSSRLERKIDDLLIWIENKCRSDKTLMSPDINERLQSQLPQQPTRSLDENGPG